ncbi:hypothetical protein IE81DRAFT_233902 [Ceraceosorus guamensis]|uniref:HAM1-like C-terminal domain-containing protein n=1 Tax=Ceraceosorus guamensis TaxID=1522189 RepID=A0A316VRS6_9BASI|nr:hypothetical protein IE81DRAFT_233902 [Ceraceosorus guamensis]PWN40306.1 hypothetical protein IE81DRAFT_233902 [Ceraceosorus guamensis]
MEKAQELVDDGQRTHFFNVRNVAVDAGAFDFELRKSHHWILNSFFLRPLARPIVRLVLQRVVAALIEDTFERADKQAWDLHVRATRLARSREGTSSEGKAEWMDYVRVLMDNKAGKSRARRRLERKRRELMQRRQEREKDRQRREEEELARRSEQQERREIEGGQRTENRQTRQLRKGQTMRVTPTKHAARSSSSFRLDSQALIKSDTSGSYALSVGLAPRLLAPHKRGPSTKRTDLRDDLVQQNWKSLGQRPVEQAREGWEEAAEETDLLLPFRTAQEQVDNVRGMAKEVKRGNERIRREERQIDARQESSAPTASKGWKTDLFDL